MSAENPQPKPDTTLETAFNSQLGGFLAKMNDEMRFHMRMAFLSGAISAAAIEQNMGHDYLGEQVGLFMATIKEQSNESSGAE